MDKAQEDVKCQFRISHHEAKAVEGSFLIAVASSGNVPTAICKKFNDLAVEERDVDLLAASFCLNQRVCYPDCEVEGSLKRLREYYER